MRFITNGAELRSVGQPDTHQPLILTNETRNLLYIEFGQSWDLSRVETSKDDTVEWMIVKSKSFVEEFQDIKELRKEWRNSTKYNGNLSYKLMTDLAKKHNVITGKWIFYVEEDSNINEIWHLIATSIVNGKLGKICICAKLRFPQADYENMKHKHAISVCNLNFEDIIGVLAIERELREMGVINNLKYKPDVYSYCGIFLNNQWGIVPSIYDSVYKVEERESIIEKQPFISKEKREKNLQLHDQCKCLNLPWFYS